MNRLLLAAVAASFAFGAPAAANNGKQVGLGKNVTVTTDAQAAAARKAAKDKADQEAAAKAKADKEAAEKQAAAEAAARAAAEAEAAARAAAEAEAARKAAEAAAAAAAADEADKKAKAAKAQADEQEAAASARAEEARKLAKDRVKNNSNAGGGNPSIPVPDSAITFLMNAAEQEFAVDYTGYVEEQLAPGLGGFGHFRFLGSTDGLTWEFQIVSLENISSLPITASRLSGYGFNVAPDAVDVTATGLFDSVEQNGNVPMLGNREICFKPKDNPSCAGNGGGGLLIGESTTGSFSIKLATASNSLTLDKFFVRFQSISGAAGGDSGVGTGIVTAVPEPATWAMLIAGFGAVGGAMRIRRRRDLALAA